VPPSSKFSNLTSRQGIKKPMTTSSPEYITIVSGLPRSGTSLMMQMIHAGGIPALTDKLRQADTDNPRGYFEFEKVKQIKADRTWLDEAQGKVVKMVHLLLMDLPTDRSYRVVVMRRDLAEVIRSQQIMLQHSGKPGAALNSEPLAKIYSQQMERVLKWLGTHSGFSVLQMQYAELIVNPNSQAERINQFLGGHLNVPAMVKVVDPTLYRNRTP
jgi:hypothetical protein